MFSLALSYGRFPFLFAALNMNEWIHLSECFKIFLELCFQQMNAELTQRIACLRDLFAHSCDLKLADYAIMISPLALNPIKVIVNFSLKMYSVCTTVHLVKNNGAIINNTFLDVELTDVIDSLADDGAFNQSERLKRHVSSFFAV